MARRVYFAFHYQRDIWRVNQVRNSNVVEGFDEAGFIDGSLWEEAKKKGDAAIKKLIDDSLKSTTVTVVLIGAKTSEREYVEYEIDQSWNKGNGIIGIYIHQLENQQGETDIKGADPLVKFDYKGIWIYDWVDDNGYDNIGNWVDAAYERAQKRQKNS
jgi:hypothetical protein